MKRFIIPIICLLLLLTACQTESINTDQSEKSSTETIVPLTDINNELGFSLIKLAYDETENVLLSPTSALLALFMAYNGAEGDTKTEFEETLKLTSYTREDINLASKQFIAALQEKDDAVDIAIANSLWINEKYSFHDDYASSMKNYYNATIEAIDIANPQSAARINDWVKEQTKGKITEIVAAPLPNDLLAYIVNALYFNGKWTYAFDPSLTTEKTFYGADEEIDLPFMTLTEQLPYFATETFQAVKLPYGDGKLAMQIMLPSENTPLTELINFITDDWETWQNKFSEQEGTVVMPKFTLEEEIVLNDLLQEMGMKAAFDSERADFTNMAEASERIFINEVKQKAYIDVHEEGTEAAAVTSVEVSVTSAIVDEVEPFYMEINRPFLLTIQDEETGQIVFIGTIQQLDNSK